MERKFVKNAVTGSRRGSAYPPEDKEKALALMSVGTSLRDIEKRLKIPYSTLKEWEKAALIPAQDEKESKLRQQREKQRENIINKAYKAASLGLDYNVNALKRARADSTKRQEIVDKITGEALSQEEYDELFRKLTCIVTPSMGDITKLIGVMIDKLQLMENRPTVISESSSELNVQGALTGIGEAELLKLASMAQEAVDNERTQQSTADSVKTAD